MNKYLKQEHDKFKDKTIIQLTDLIPAKCLEESSIWASDDSKVNLRHISMPELKALVLDFETTISGQDDLGAGKLLMIIDDNQRYTLEAHESYATTYESIKEVSCWYDIPMELLKSICDAKSIDIRFTAQNDTKYVDVIIPKLQWAAKVMYNEIVDNTAYLEEIQENEEIITDKNKEEDKEVREDKEVSFISTKLLWIFLSIFLIIILMVLFCVP